MIKLELSFINLKYSFSGLINLDLDNDWGLLISEDSIR